jgi:hypothetical protein
MGLKQYRERSGRIRAIAFYCQRCKKIEFRLVTEEMIKHSEDNLQCYTPPDGWEDHFYGLLCDKCNEAYKKFMLNEELTDESRNKS